MGIAPNLKNFAEAEMFINDLNGRNYAGYNKWRLPTLEEAMSLMTPQQRAGMHINPIFDQHQKWMWTGDKENSVMAWGVNFVRATCGTDPIDYYYDVRAVFTFDDIEIK